MRPSEDQPTAIMLGMTRREAYEFLKGLAGGDSGEDDSLRRELESDPAAVLERYRFWIAAPEELTDEVRLPPKEVMQGLLELLSQPDESGHVEATPEAYGFALFGVIFRVAFAMPLIAPERASSASG